MLIFFPHPKKIKEKTHLMPKLLDIDKFCENLMEVKTSKIFDKSFFHSDGLYSEQIFGPLKNYTCQCGIYHTYLKAGERCKVCNVLIEHSKIRRKTFAKIVLPFPIVNPIFYDLISNIGGKKLQELIDELMIKEKSVLYKDEENEEYVVTTQPELLHQDIEKYEKLEAIQELIQDLSKKFIDTEDWKLINKNINCLLIRNVIILPPDLRPISKSMKKTGQQVSDEINRFYMKILVKKEIVENTIVDLNKDKKIFYQYYTKMQEDINELYENLLLKLSKKKGLIRNNILGKRIDFSGRAVITPEPTLDLDECVIPYLMFLELYKIKIAKKLIENGKFNLINNAIDYVDECIDRNDTSLFSLCRELCVDEYCLLNRQPSLHRLSILGFKVGVSLDHTIKTHPLVCPAFNADYDGDQQAVYIPITEATKTEIKEKLLASKNLSNPSNSNLIATPSQDLVLGIYVLTNNLLEGEEYNKYVEFKGQTITKSRKIFNDCLPTDYPLIDRPIKNKDLIEILENINECYDHTVVKNTLDKIKAVGFKYSTLFGPTLSLQDMEVDGFEKKKNEIYKENSSITEKLNIIQSKEIEETLKNRFKQSYMVESGSRGSWDQVRQILLTRGYISNFKGKILSTPVKNSLLHGLTPKEFFLSTYGSRKGLLDVALNTGVSGYLSRKLIFCCANLQLDESLEDCGTEDCLKVFVDSERKAEMLIHRFIINENKLEKITKENCYSFINKTIFLRSPIYCKQPKICKTCYGELYKVLRSRYIGIIAAQSLGEANTQLVLKNFHHSGSAMLGKETDQEETDLHQSDVVSALSKVSKILHNFEDRKEYEIVSELFEIYNSSRKISHIHFESVVAQLMWVGYNKWRLGENRKEVAPSFYSVQSVPSYESWILGLGFSKPKHHILKGLLISGKYKGIFDKIIFGEELN